MLDENNSTSFISKKLLAGNTINYRCISSFTNEFAVLNNDYALQNFTINNNICKTANIAYAYVMSNYNSVFLEYLNSKASIYNQNGNLTRFTNILRGLQLKSNVLYGLCDSLVEAFDLNYNDRVQIMFEIMKKKFGNIELYDVLFRTGTAQLYNVIDYFIVKIERLTNPTLSMNKGITVKTQEDKIDLQIKHIKSYDLNAKIYDALFWGLLRTSESYIGENMIGQILMALRSEI